MKAGINITTIIEKRINDIQLIAISGRIDVISAKDLEVILNNAIDNKSKIIFDLSETEYISSTGLRVLLVAQKEIREKKGEMRFASPQPLIRNILDISGLSNIFSIHHNLKDAMDSLGSK